MSNTDPNLKYAESHEWAKQLVDDVVEVGISDYAQEALGDVVYVDLPEVGDSFGVAEEVCAVESVKAASDIYAPVEGEVIEVNDALEDEPELLNSSPYGGGWIFRIKATNLSQLDDLLDAEAYDSSTAD